jgi:hypothetical protein
LVSIEAGRRAWSSVSTVTPGGSMARTRSARRAASKAAISTTPAPLEGMSVSGRIVSPARVAPTARTSCA